MIGFRQRSFRHPVTINENQIYLARLENDRWYRVQVAKITEEIANVFCIDRGISQEVDIKRIRVIMFLSFFSQKKERYELQVVKSLIYYNTLRYLFRLEI